MVLRRETRCVFQQESNITRIRSKRNANILPCKVDNAGAVERYFMVALP